MMPHLTRCCFASAAHHPLLLKPLLHEGGRLQEYVAIGACQSCPSCSPAHCLGTCHHIGWHPLLHGSQLGDTFILCQWCPVAHACVGLQVDAQEGAPLHVLPPNSTMWLKLVTSMRSRKR